MNELDKTLLIHERAILQSTLSFCRLDQKLISLKAVLITLLPKDFENLLVDAETATLQLDADSDTISRLEKRIQELKELLDS